MPGQLRERGQGGVRACRHQQRGAVRIGAHQFVDGKGAAGAGLALHQDRLADLLAELLADDARHHVDAAARRERHQQADRSVDELRLRQRVRCGAPNVTAARNAQSNAQSSGLKLRIGIPKSSRRFSGA